MRISRKKRPERPLIPHYNVNENIIAPQVRVIDNDGKNLGVFATAEAIRIAREKEMDLVEINPLTNPPVAKIAMFKQFKYQKEKEARKQKAGAHVSEVKGIRLSIRIGDHDLDVRRAQAQNFLERGDKVKVEVILRGRENARADLAHEVIGKLYKMLAEKMSIYYEQPIVRQGNKITGTIARK